MWVVSVFVLCFCDLGKGEKLGEELEKEGLGRRMLIVVVVRVGKFGDRKDDGWMVGDRVREGGLREWVGGFGIGVYVV